MTNRIVDDEIHCTPTATILWEVRGTLTRPDFIVPGVRGWEAPLPVLAIWADTPEEAVMAYKASLNDILMQNIRDQIARDEVRVHVWTKEVGETAPYSYGDYCEVFVTNDANLAGAWTECIVFGAHRHSSGTRWEVQVILGFAGTNPFLGRAWADDDGVGDLIRPVQQEVAGPLLPDLVIPSQAVHA